MRCLFVLVFACASGCAGELENPERFEGTFADAAAGCDVEALFANTCGISACHDATEPGGGLDLVSPGVASRMVDVASSCNGTPLIDSTNVGASFLLDKLSPPPSCGDPMPLLGDPLSAAQVECVTVWAEDQL